MRVSVVVYINAFSRLEWAISLGDSMKLVSSILGAAFLAAVVPLASAQQFSGAIQTTTSSATTVNSNTFQAKDDVYLTGGPQNTQSQGLPNGLYYYQVTDPSGATLLSTEAPKKAE